MKKQTSTPPIVSAEEVVKKPLYKKAWLWILLTVVVAAVVLCVCLWPRATKTKLSDQLAACVVDALYAQHASDHTVGKYPTVAYTVLDVYEEGDKTTVYGVMLYREYTSTQQGELKVWGTSHSPFAITAKKTTDGYKAEECWWPKDGGEYRSSIEEKFPVGCREKAINAYQYYAEHDAACAADAMQNIKTEDQYAVLLSEKQTLWLAYQPSGVGCYIMATGTFSADGTYAMDGDSRMVFTFGDCNVVCTIDGDAYTYSEKESQNIPDSWKGGGEAAYLKDGVVFYLKEDVNVEEDENTIPVGLTYTISSSNWMTETALRDMFGQFVPSTFPFDTADVHYLPVRPIETRGQLDTLIATFGDSWSELKAENFTQFDEAFFEDNYLMMTYYKGASSSWKPKVASYVLVQEDTTTWLSVRLEVYQPNPSDDALGQWVLFSGIQKADYEKVKNNNDNNSIPLEAYVEKEIEQDAFMGGESDLTFTGKVTQVEGTAVLMECYDVGQFFQGVWVELGDMAVYPQVGEEYVVTYEDMMMPSLPPRITAVSFTPKT